MVRAQTQYIDVTEKKYMTYKDFISKCPKILTKKKINDLFI